MFKFLAKIKNFIFRKRVLKGEVVCCMVWDRALTAKEIKQLYENPFCLLKTNVQDK